MTGNLIRHEEVLGFTISASVHEAYVYFNAYQITGVEEWTRKFLYEGVDSDSEPELSKAAVYFHGAVKWDGCSNWLIGDGEVMLHACDRDILRNAVEAMSLCWDWAAELLPNSLMKNCGG